MAYMKRFMKFGGISADDSHNAEEGFVQIDRDYTCLDSWDFLKHGRIEWNKIHQSIGGLIPTDAFTHFLLYTPEQIDSVNKLMLQIEKVVENGEEREVIKCGAYEFFASQIYENHFAGSFEFTNGMDIVQNRLKDFAGLPRQIQLKMLKDHLEMIHEVWKAEQKKRNYEFDEAEKAIKAAMYNKEKDMDSDSDMEEVRLVPTKVTKIKKSKQKEEDESLPETKSTAPIIGPPDKSEELTPNFKKQKRKHGRALPQKNIFLPNVPDAAESLPPPPPSLQT